MSAQKVRLVIDVVRGMKVDDALDYLKFMPQRAAIEGALEFRAAPQSLNQKFGDGRGVVEELFNAMLSWIEESNVRAAS